MGAGTYIKVGGSVKTNHPSPRRILTHLAKFKKIVSRSTACQKVDKWKGKVEHYRNLLVKVIDQTDRRVIQKESVAASGKIVSVFEHHTDIFVKGKRETRYGHKLNFSIDVLGFITCISIGEGNLSDKEVFLLVLHDHQSATGI